MCLVTSADERISVLRALLRPASDFDVVATAEDYDGVIAGAVSSSEEWTARRVRRRETGGDE